MRIVIGVLLTGYLSILFLFNFTPTQRWLADVVEQILEDKLGTEVNIGRLELGLFNRIILHDVEVKDKNRETLLKGSLLSAKIEYRALLEGRLSLRSVSVLDGRANLYKTAQDSAANYQFVLDAFKSKDSGPSHLNLVLNSLIIRRCHVTYNERFKPHNPHRFDVSHIDVSGLDANISLKCLTPDSINLRVRSLAMKEHSGLDVKALSFQLAANRSKCEITKFELRLPESYFEEDALSATYAWGDEKAFTNTVRLQGNINGAKIATKDIACLLPQLHQYPHLFTLTASFDIRPESIHLRNVQLREAQNNIVLRGQADFLRDKGNIVQINSTLEELTLQKDVAPALLQMTTADKQALSVIDNLGAISLKARGTFIKEGRSHINGEITTDVGNLYASVHWRGASYAAQLSSSQLSMAALLANKHLPDNVAFHADINAESPKHQLAKVTTSLLLDKADYNGYTYNNIAMNADWRQSKLNVELASTDPNLNASANLSGYFDGRRLSDIHINTELHNLNAVALHLTKPLGAASYTGRLEAQIPYIDKQRPAVAVNILDFTKQPMESPSDTYRLDHLNLSLSPSDYGTRLKLDCDFAKVDFDGPLSATAFKQMLQHLAAKALPDLASAGSLKKSGKPEWKLSATVLKSDFFRQVLNIPLDFDSPIMLNGYIAEAEKRSSFVASADEVTYNGIVLKQLRCYLHGEDGRLAGLVQGVKRIGKLDMKLDLNVTASDGTLQGDLSWDDGNKHSFKGELKTLSDFSKTLQGQTQVNTQILPTQVTLGDTIWHISPGYVSYSGQQLDVNGLRLSHQDQSLSIVGRLSKNITDSLSVMLQKVDISYFLGLANLRAVSFSGEATGTAYLRPTTDGHVGLQANLRIPAFCFNNGYMGDADIKGAFATNDKRLHLDADIQEAGVGNTLVKGYVGIGEKALDLQVTNKNTTLTFLQRYVPDIFSNINGRTTGTCRIYGPFKQLDFEGKEQANIFATVNATGCSYHVSDGIVNISPGTFDFSAFHVTDDNGGTGDLNGTLKHDHLKNVRYDFTADTRHLIIYDKGPNIDLPFYATAYGTGTARLHGRPKQFTADINMRPDAGTLFVYTVDTPDTGTDVTLLQFQDKNDAETVAANGAVKDSLSSGRTDGIRAQQNANRAKTVAAKDEPSTDIQLNFLLDMVPAARLRVITDERTGDNITLSGSGAIRATYYNKGSFQMFGTYTVQEGLFKMVIQDIIHKDFLLQSGGMINFVGDPYEGDLRLQAVYTVPSASLSDLGLNFSDKSVRADCVLNLSGKIKAPQVTFDLSLPSVSEEVKQMVKQLIVSEEDMNMQILYLLGVGRFYNYNYAATDAAMGGQSQSTAAMKSFLSNTLSGQLNNLISNAMGNSNWTFGANLSTGQVGWSDMEVGGLLSGRLLNNRLLVNGVIGYRDRTTSTANFVGDFDINYLLTPSGNVSLKAYSETNDRYFSKSSLTTQGIGILLKRDFTKFSDLFTLPDRRRRQANDSTATRKRQ